MTIYDYLEAGMPGIYYMVETSNIHFLEDTTRTGQDYALMLFMACKIASLYDSTGLPSQDEYRIYLQSDHWREVRKNIIENRVKCQICGLEGTTVHHQHYHNLGEERDQDLWLLCTPCHKVIHDIARHSIVPSGLALACNKTEPAITGIMVDNINVSLFLLIAAVKKILEFGAGTDRLKEVALQAVMNETTIDILEMLGEGGIKYSLTGSYALPKETAE